MRMQVKTFTSDSRPMHRMRNGVVKRGEIVKAKGVGKLAGGKWSASRWRGLRRVEGNGWTL